MMDTHPQTMAALLRHGHSWIPSVPIHVCCETKKSMTNDAACKSIGIRLTNKTCYPLGLIAKELEP